MIFTQHSALSGKHAFLSPSNYSWVNYDDQRLESRYFSHRAAVRGVDLHELAHQAIKLGVRIAEAEITLASYVDHAITYKMSVEQPLYYSDNCFGTADTICFWNDLLRIHDLKTGITKVSERQLEIYAALFCLEYNYSPYDIDIELRIYQRGEILTFVPTPEHIYDLMEKIVLFDKRIEYFKEVELDEFR